MNFCLEQFLLRYKKTVIIFSFDNCLYFVFCQIASRMFRSILRMNVAAINTATATMSAATGSAHPSAIAETLDKFEFGSSLWVSAQKSNWSVARDSKGVASTPYNGQTTYPAKGDTLDLTTDYDDYELNYSHWD